MKKKLIIILIVMLILLVSTVLIVQAITSNEKKIGLDIGTIFSKYKVKGVSKETKATVNDYIITKDDVDYYLEIYEITGKEVSEKEIIDKQIEKYLVLQEAKKVGIVVNEEEFESSMKELRSSIDESSKDDPAIVTMKAFCKSVGITEDEYWDLSYEVYRDNYIIGLFQNKYLKPKMPEENPDSESFKEYYHDYIDELMSKADIEYYE